MIKKSKLKNQNSVNGFTLIETLVVVSVFALIMIAVSSAILYFYRTNTATLEQAYAINSARKGIEFMVRDIREAIYSDEGAYPVISMGANSFYFYSDTDRDESVERIRYFIDGTDLKKGITEASGDPPKYLDMNEFILIISDSARNIEQEISVFNFFDEYGVEITDYAKISDVAFVKVNLIVNINASSSPDEFTLRSSATLRNLKTNL
jgi:prepilin-type N-terminal cleavage/methylation domain-containing protein